MMWCGEVSGGCWRDTPETGRAECIERAFRFLIHERAGNPEAEELAAVEGRRRCEDTERCEARKESAGRKVSGQPEGENVRT
jgi:hypothetical protein